jgi:epoxyqueuosine reductase
MRKDSRPVLRGTAAWALGKIGGETALAALVDACEKEQDLEVQAEIQKGLNCYNRA